MLSDGSSTLPDIKEYSESALGDDISYGRLSLSAEGDTFSPGLPARVCDVLRLCIGIISSFCVRELEPLEKCTLLSRFRAMFSIAVGAVVDQDLCAVRFMFQTTRRN